MEKMPMNHTHLSKSQKTDMEDNSLEKPGHSGELAGEDNDALYITNNEEKRRLRRERQKQKREIKKQEKAILREEEMMKKRLAPKDQKVTIIDHQTLDRLLVKENVSIKSETREKNVYCGSEFPSLGEVISASSRMSANGYQRSGSRQRSHVNKSPLKERSSPGKKRQEKFRQTQTDQDQHNSTIICANETNAAFCDKSQQRQAELQSETKTGEDANKSIKQVDDKTSGKRPKRKDPIQLDIHEILKVQETKQEVKQQTTNKNSQKCDTPRYGGNILDSDNPERKRGKQREVPKAKKPSNLKQIILQERVKRKDVRLQDAVMHMYGINIHDTNLLKTEAKLGNVDLLTNIPQIEQESLPESRSNLNTNHEMIVTKVLRRGDREQGQDAEQKASVRHHVESNNKMAADEKQSATGGKAQEQEEAVASVKEAFTAEDGKNFVCEPLKRAIEPLFQNETRAPRPRIHSRKFREYCDHSLTPEILTATTALLEDIVKFHDRQFARNPLKAAARRRHVTGLKEVRRFLALHRVRLLFIAPDLEPTPGAGGLDDIVNQLKEAALANGVPYVFALGRRQLGYILKKKVPVSCVGVLNYDGSENNFRNLMSAVDKAREHYRTRVAALSPTCLAPVIPVSSTETKQHENRKEKADGGARDHEEDDINKEVVASLLAKLSEPKDRGTPSPFLSAIERITLESDSDDTLDTEE